MKSHNKSYLHVYIDVLIAEDAFEVLLTYMMDDCLVNHRLASVNNLRWAYKRNTRIHTCTYTHTHM